MVLHANAGREIMANNGNGQGVIDAQLGYQRPIAAGAIRYVNKVDSGGWLRVLANHGADLYLHKYTKLVLQDTKGGRTYLNIMDGHNKGLTVSIKDTNATEYLGTMAPKLQAAMVVVDYQRYDAHWKSLPRGGQILKQQLAKLTVNGIHAVVTMNSVWKGDQGWRNYFPIAPGAYNILLPDAPHNKNATAFYKQYAPGLSNDQVWFPIQFGDNSRYIHVGHLSDGCTTVTDLDKWAAIHEALISHRSPDGVSVGKMVVQGHRERVT
jgi:hypothetical protein